MFGLETSEGDPRAIGWVSFNYFRSEEYYTAVAVELDAIISIASIEFYDPQLDETWRGKVDRERIFGASGA